MRRAGPASMKVHTRFIELRYAIARDENALAAYRFSDRDATKARRLERGNDVVPVPDVHLKHRAELLVEERGERRSGYFVESNHQAASAGERHLGQRGEQTSVRAVVIGEQLSVTMQRLDRGEERFEQLRIIEIGCFVAEPAVDLRQ